MLIRASLTKLLTPITSCQRIPRERMYEILFLVFFLTRILKGALYSSITRIVSWLISRNAR